MQTVYMVKEESDIESYYVVQDDYALFTDEGVAQQIADSLNRSKSSGEVEYKVVPLILNSVGRSDETWYPVHAQLSATEQKASRKVSTKASGGTKSSGKKRAGKKAEQEPVDLMAALEASLARAKGKEELS